MFSSLHCLLFAADIATGTWAARLDSPHGPLPFGLEITAGAGGLAAVVVNGRERVDVPLKAVDGSFVFDFPHYAATLTAKLDATGRKLDGEWSKRAGPDTHRKLPFHAEWSPSAARTAAVTPPDRIPDVSGRWRVRFAKDPDPAVAIFDGGPKTRGAIEGTFLTATGDFRYLAGTYDEHLLLTCFDGAHAFRFAADMLADGTLAGTFSSGNAHTDSWTAVRDDSAKLPDEFGRVQWDESYGWNELWFADKRGQLVSLGDSRFDGKARILQLTGSWCPNCHDETVLLAELHGEYSAKGLEITALCFELTGRSDTDTQAAQSMFARHKAAYEWLLAGRSEKQFASAALPTLERVFAFPTTIFIGRDGRVRAVHTGFSGPATGDAHRALRADFRRRIEELLVEKPHEDEALREKITHELWRDEQQRTFTTIARDESGKWSFSALAMTRFDGPTPTEPVDSGAVVFNGTTVRLGRKSWTYDRRAQVLLDPSDCGNRLTPAVRSPFPVIDGIGYSEMPQILEGLSSGSPQRRRDSAYYLALQILTDRVTPPEMGGGRIPSGIEANLTPLFEDADPRVRATASWAAGAVGSKTAVAALEKNLDHGYAPVRREAARALRQLAPEAARARLAWLAEHDIDPLVREAAAR